MTEPPPGWPFFAPSADDGVARALKLADLQPGEHLVDLGCGDGQVLVAAALQGARVTGIEFDPELAAEAVGNLRATDANAGTCRVIVGDLFEPWDLGPVDVFFSYLSPATLQRLWPRLRDRHGARLVTVDFEVPDVVADAADGVGHPGAAFLYRMPGRPRGASGSERIGWPHPGSLCVQPPEVSSLTTLELVHAGGPVTVQADVPLTTVAELAQGCDEAGRGRMVAIDVRWSPQEPGVVAHGVVSVDGVGDHQLTVVFSEDEQGQWDLSDDGCTTVTARMDASHRAGPPTADELLALLDAER